jgi:YD repeat-containing protein
MAGLQEIVTGAEGSIILIDGDGSELLFEPPATSGAPFVLPPGDFSILEQIAGNTFRRTMTDQTVYQFDSRGELASMRDRNNNETRFEYNSAGHITKWVDPVGLETTFASTGDCGVGTSPARVCSIIDPAGRVTQLKSDAAGNLIRVMDPDGSQRNWEYDARYHMTAETDKRGLREESFYDEFGRFQWAIRSDGSVVDLTPGSPPGAGWRARVSPDS